MVVQRIDLENSSIQKELQKEKEKLSREFMERGSCDIDDFVMVTATNHIEEDHIDKPPSQFPFVITPSTEFYIIMCEMEGKQKNSEIYYSYLPEEEVEEIRNTAKQYTPLSTQYRSTIHYTLNGLVSNHDPMKGDFEGRKFVIISKLSNHIGKDDIRNLAMQDTFVYGSSEITDDSIVLIEELKYEELLKEFPYLETYNIILYKGDQKKATEYVIAKMGILPEKIEAHNAENTERTPIYIDFYYKMINNGINSGGEHFYSPESKEDDEKSLIIWKIYKKDVYSKMFEYFNTDKQTANRIFDILERESYSDFGTMTRKVLKEFILSVGVERYKQFVIEYNNEIREAIANGIYPTNDEILAAGKLYFKDGKGAPKKK